MVQVTQTDEDVKIIIELNRLITRKPDVVLLPCYVKFNSPPIFFERHLVQEIDEVSSFCHILKNEARIVLIKKQKGIWPDLFLKLSKEELQKRRMEIANKLTERNQERDKQKLDRYELKRKNEIEKETQRETAMRERQKQYQENACRDALLVGVRKEAHTKEKRELHGIISSIRNARLDTPTMRHVPTVSLNSCASINFSYSCFNMRSPKTESQEIGSEHFKILADTLSSHNRHGSEVLETVKE